jgi:hypothetical protein
MLPQRRRTAKNTLVLEDAVVACMYTDTLVDSVNE